ncbi:MAG: hypothetical protein EPO28_00210 [Saprospiraceae bacterium]|nr:MAG: hypothetical protein EPO28_00210 [Saprospiraceae bacterium]
MPALEMGHLGAVDFWFILVEIPNLPLAAPKLALRNPFFNKIFNSRPKSDIFAALNKGVGPKAGAVGTVAKF